MDFTQTVITKVMVILTFVMIIALFEYFTLTESTLNDFKNRLQYVQLNHSLTKSHVSGNNSMEIGSRDVKSSKSLIRNATDKNSIDIASNNTISLQISDSSIVERSHNLEYINILANANFVTLPSFSDDLSDFILNSIIERSSNNEYGLFISTFFLNHYLLQPKVLHDLGTRRCSPKTHQQWRLAANEFSNLEYAESGKRSVQYEYYCRIHLSSVDLLSDTAVVVNGDFLPNRLTTHTGSNRRIDILRCPLPFNISRNITKIHEFVIANQTIHVNLILKNKGKSRSLVNFTIPWKSRVSGYLFPTTRDDSDTKLSCLDSWERFSPPSS